MKKKTLYSRVRIIPGGKGYHYYWFVIFPDTNSGRSNERYHTWLISEYDAELIGNELSLKHSYEVIRMQREKWIPVNQWYSMPPKKSHFKPKIISFGPGLGARFDWKSSWFILVPSILESDKREYDVWYLDRCHSSEQIGSFLSIKDCHQAIKMKRRHEKEMVQYRYLYGKPISTIK